MMRVRAAIVAAAVTVLSPLAATTLAHHGWGEYDSRKPMRGVTREQLTQDATITVVAFPHKSRATEMKAAQIKVGHKTTDIR